MPIPRLFRASNEERDCCEAKSKHCFLTGADFVLVKGFEPNVTPMPHNVGKDVLKNDR